MKSMKTFSFVLIFSLLLVGCNQDEEKAIQVVEQIYTIQSEIPSQREYDKIYESYENLTDKQKEMVTNKDVLLEHKGLDLDNINKVNDEISTLNETSKYADVLKIEEKYNELSKDEKKYIDNYDSISKLKELTELDKAAVSAVQNIKKSLKDSSSLEIININVKDTTDRLNFYLVLVEYSATNSFGGRTESSSCITITEDFEDPFYPLALLAGSLDKYLNNPETYANYYLPAKETEYKIDTDKIMSNLK